MSEKNTKGEDPRVASFLEVALERECQELADQANLDQMDPFARMILDHTSGEGSRKDCLYDSGMKCDLCGRTTLGISKPYQGDRTGKLTWDVGCFYAMGRGLCTSCIFVTDHRELRALHLASKKSPEAFVAMYRKLFTIHNDRAAAEIKRMEERGEIEVGEPFPLEDLDRRLDAATKTPSASIPIDPNDKGVWIPIICADHHADCHNPHDPLSSPYPWLFRIHWSPIIPGPGKTLYLGCARAGKPREEMGKKYYPVEYGEHFGEITEEEARELIALKQAQNHVKLMAQIKELVLRGKP